MYQLIDATPLQYVKACRCKATATTGALRCSGAPTADSQWHETWTLHPGPSCDGCGKPWRIVLPPATTE